MRALLTWCSVELPQLAAFFLGAALLLGLSSPSGAQSYCEKWAAQSDKVPSNCGSPKLKHTQLYDKEGRPLNDREGRPLRKVQGKAVCKLEVIQYDCPNPGPGISSRIYEKYTLLSSTSGEPDDMLNLVSLATEGYLDCLHGRPPPQTTSLEDLDPDFNDWKGLAASTREQVARGFGYHLCQSISIGQAVQQVGGLVEVGGKVVSNGLKAAFAKLSAKLTAKKSGAASVPSGKVEAAKSATGEGPESRAPPSGPSGSTTNPLRGSAIVDKAKNLAGQTIDLGGGGIVTLGEKVAEGGFGAVYKIPGQPGRLFKIIHDTEAGAGAVTGQVNGHNLIKGDPKGLPTAQIFSSGKNPPYLITEDIHAGQWAAKGARLATGALDKAEKDAVKALYDNLARKGFIWLDGHQGNIFFFREGGALKAGILDQDFIYRLRDFHKVDLDNTTAFAKFIGWPAYEAIWKANKSPGSVSAKQLMDEAFKRTITHERPPS
jgi:hypothetical protein